jgi:hypothetical protein
MSVSLTHVYCNECEVKDAPAVERVLAQYHSSLEFAVDNKAGCPQRPVLVPEVSSGYDESEWPQAVDVDEFEQEYEEVLPEPPLDGEEWSDADWDRYFDTLYEAYLKHGDEGFVQMLSALGPHLATPLTVQAISFDSGGWDPVVACEWHVKPGSTTVDVNQFQHSQGAPAAAV